MFKHSTLRFFHGFDSCFSPRSSTNQSFLSLFVYTNRQLQPFTGAMPRFQTAFFQGTSSWLAVIFAIYTFGVFHLQSMLSVKMMLEEPLCIQRAAPRHSMHYHRSCSNHCAQKTMNWMQFPHCKPQRCISAHLRLLGHIFHIKRNISQNYPVRLMRRRCKNLLGSTAVLRFFCSANVELHPATPRTKH